jgi:DnaJ-class molecular chaperone
VAHPAFRRVGASLYVTHSITLKESLLGFSHVLTHLDGKTFEIKREAVTPEGLVDVLKHKGMPKDMYSEDGDLYVEYQVVYPASFTSSQLQHLKLAFQ